MGEHMCGDTQVTELPAVLVSINSVHADGVGGLVHELTVAGRHHVTAQGGVDGGWEVQTKLNRI